MTICSFIKEHHLQAVPSESPSNWTMSIAYISLNLLVANYVGLHPSFFGCAFRNFPVSFAALSHWFRRGRAGVQSARMICVGLASQSLGRSARSRASPHGGGRGDDTGDGGHGDTQAHDVPPPLLHVQYGSHRDLSQTCSCHSASLPCCWIMSGGQVDGENRSQWSPLGLSHPCCGTSARTGTMHVEAPSAIQI